MLAKVMDTIKTYDMLKLYDKIVVGVSGGADSVCLLHILRSLQDVYHLTLTVVHVHHGLRGEEADLDLLFVKELCRTLSVAFFPFHFRIEEEAKKMRVSLEEAGRIKRYESFREVRRKIDGQKIAVAHNQNDNAETVFMHLCRGAGLLGLSGIAPHTGSIIRPLIFCGRNEIEDYLHSHHLLSRDDETNGETVYTRNKIRHVLLPFIKREINPGVTQTISKTSVLLREENDFMEQEAKKCFDAALLEKDEKEVRLRIDSILPLHKALQRRVMRLALKNTNCSLKDFSYEAVSLCLNILYMPTGKKYSLPEHITVEKQYGTLLFYKEAPKEKDGFCYPLPLHEIIFIKETNQYVLAATDLEKFHLNRHKLCTKIFDYDKIKNSLCVRTRKPGDRIVLEHMSKKVKNILIDLKIPREQRACIPIVCAGNDILWIFDIRTSFYFSRTESKNKIFIAFWEE